MKNKGILFGLGAYLAWGFFPLYFKAIHFIPAMEIVAHRITWSFIFLAIILLVRKEWKSLRQVAFKPKTLAVYTVAAVLLAANWSIYVWAVNSDYVVETSLGYFINPLVSVLLGVFLLRERLRPLQWVPVILASLAVLYLTVEFGSLPWIALSLAFTFGLYGLVKKISPLGSLYGLSMETAILFLPALAYLLYLQNQGSAVFINTGWTYSILLALSGVVTSVPLLMFASAARSIPLSMVGILQYVAPTCQFILGIWVFHEPFTVAQLAGFAIIWLALAIFTIEGFISYRRTVSQAAAS